MLSGPRPDAGAAASPREGIVPAPPGRQCPRGAEPWHPARPQLPPQGALQKGTHRAWAPTVLTAQGSCWEEFLWHLEAAISTGSHCSVS